MSNRDKIINDALELAWHGQSAGSSLQRWVEICEKENWGDIPENIPLLIAIFGASWYFTRYIYYRGRDAADMLDKLSEFDFSPDSFSQRLMTATEMTGIDEKLDQLRLLKNEIMLQILAAKLAGNINQEQTEEALTDLADICLDEILEIFEFDELEGVVYSVYGLGRMAGHEMTFGSDLDLIFLYESSSQEQIYELSRKVRQLMREIATAGAAGTLYDVDMRLRPHGTSGALLTSSASFIEYNQEEREIWERQMMTRCEAVIDKRGLGQSCLDKVNPAIYAEYDQEYLRSEILAMRKRVEREKGVLKGKFEVKRGRGGLMDIDFLTHFIQLAHGARIQQLQTCSTRAVLSAAAVHGLLDKQSTEELLSAYDFLKQAESVIRLFDMKPVSAFSVDTEAHAAVAAAMGYAGNKAPDFLEKYNDVTSTVRNEFIMHVGKL